MTSVSHRRRHTGTWSSTSAMAYRPSIARTAYRSVATTSHTRRVHLLTHRSSMESCRQLMVAPMRTQNGTAAPTNQTSISAVSSPLTVTTPTMESKFSRLPEAGRCAVTTWRAAVRPTHPGAKRFTTGGLSRPAKRLARADANSRRLEYLLQKGELKCHVVAVRENLQ